VTMTMRDRLLGRTGIQVSQLCLGTMMFNTQWDWRHGADERTVRPIYDAYREAGGNFVDTANMYGDSEDIVGHLIAAERDRIVLATKFGLEVDPDDPNSWGSNRKALHRSIDASLRRLGTDYIDLLWVHAWDQRTGIDVTLRALDDLVATGKVLAVGVSNMPAWMVSRAVTMAELQGWTPFCAIQVQHSLTARTAERELFPMAEQLGLLVTGWAPLARGLLAGKEPSYPVPDHVREVATVVSEVAAELGTTSARVALAWTMQKGVVPVVGSTKVEQLTDSLGAIDLDLPEEQRKRLDDVSAIEPGYPHFFLQYKASSLGPL
jgi:aryl-alcohol dehydrogenase-like predicted oxidoreductase